VAATPSQTRPSGRRSGTGEGGAATRMAAPYPSGRLTGRAAVLAVVLVGLALSYVFPLRVYLAQQAEISQLRAQQAEQQVHVDELAAEAALWEDDDYIRIQARKRLYFGEPGEILLIPLWGDEQEPLETGLDPDETPTPPDPWWDTLWSSVRTANGAGSAGDPAEPEQTGAPEQSGAPEQTGAPEETG
jgi:cell division protein FtsB